MNLKLLKNYIIKYNFSIDENKIGVINKYYHLLLSYQNKHGINLTNITDEKQFIIKNILDTLLLNELLETETKIIADIGTGNGIPGIILAILNPDKKFYLIDSVKKKIIFIEYLIKSLNLNNCIPVNERLEIIPKDIKYFEFFDVVTGRAVAPLIQFIELSVPLIKKQGFLITTKSKKLNEEMIEAGNIISFCNFSLIEKKEYVIEDNLRYIIKFKKESETPDIFPRKPGLYKKRPYGKLHHSLPLLNFC